jgi:TatD DNase family protein
VIDTHCHLDKAEFDADRDAVLARARAVGVAEWIVPATGPSGWAALLELARSRPGLHAGLGIHPQLLPGVDRRYHDRILADLEAALARGGAVAVGECGLDGPSASAGAPMDRQVAVLEGQLAIARRLDLPVMLHALRAHDALLSVLERVGLPSGGVIHSFSGSAEQVLPFARLGLHFAFAGPVTYPKARKPLAAARAVPRDRLLLETDAPDQTPWPRRGRNEPSYLPLVAAAVAAARGVSASELEVETSVNAGRLFRLHAATDGARPPSTGPAT